MYFQLTGYHGADDSRHICRGYHSLSSSYGKVFHVEKRWKLVREMGTGAYGVVMCASNNAGLFQREPLNLVQCSC